MEYFLTDALGSVRQLTDSAGSVTLAKTNDPYGMVTQTSGVSQTDYGFTAEYQHNDLLYLRARHYAPGMGRFLTRDLWKGDVYEPMSYNRWLYAYGDSINLTDPTGESPIGNCSSSDLGCLIYQAPSIPFVHLMYIRSLIECDNFTVEERIQINLSAYYMPIAKGGVGEQFGEPILKYAIRRGRRVEKFFYNGELGVTKKRREALRTSGRLLYNSTEGICMQGTGKIEIEGKSPVYVYCLHGLSSPVDETPFYASWGLYPEVEAFETAARAKTNSLFRDGERVRIPILSRLFQNMCGVAGHDDTITVRSIGGGLAPNTLDVYVGAGQYSDLQACMTAIQREGGTSSLTDAYVYRRYNSRDPQ